MTRIVLVEDEPALARGLRDNFAAEGWGVLHAADAPEALRLLRAAEAGAGVDLVVLDLMLPGGSGLDVLRSLRASGSELPVLVLTAKSDVVDRVAGLELGADDYLGKPFAVSELLARMKALLRRARAGSMAALRIGDVRVDFEAMAATGPGGPLSLTVHDLRVLQALARRRGAVVSRADIVEEVCGLESDATLRTVDNHVVALRRAFEPNPRRPRYLLTVRGEGYRLALDEA